MTTLNDYMQQVQRFLRDARQEQLNPEDLLSYINRARRETAMRSQSIRRLTPISGSIISIEVTEGGTGYSDSPTITISDPDYPSSYGENPNGLQATASAVVNNGVIEQITVENGGDGYWQPTVTIEDDTGTGAEAEVSELTYINQLENGKEVYYTADIDMSMYPGVGEVYMIRSIAILFSQFRYTVGLYSFSEYQAKIRQWSAQWRYVPAIASQFGQGASSSYYFYPVPSQSYQAEFDCTCLPADMVDNNSPEALPAPWTDAVPYWAASLCYEELQNWNAAVYYAKKFDDMVQRYSNYARPGQSVNRYGRY